MKRHLCLLWTAVLALALFAGCGGGAASGGGGASEAFQQASVEGEVYKLILGHCDPEDPEDPYHSSALAFKEKAEELSGGRIQITIYPNAQLGDERAVIEAVQNGSVDVSVVTNAITSNFQPLTKIMDLPFLFQSLKEARAATGGEAAQEILDSMSDVGIRGLGFTENGFRFILNNKQPVREPEDLRGLKLRVMQSPVYLSFYNNLQSSVIPLAFGEVYTAVSQGTVDGFDLPMPVILSSKLYEVTSYMTDVRYTYTSLMIIMNEEQFAAYPQDIQDILMEAARYSRTHNFATNDAVMESGYQTLEGQIDIVSFEEVRFEEFRKASEAAWAEHVDTEQAQRIFDAILAGTK